MQARTDTQGDVIGLLIQIRDYKLIYIFIFGQVLFFLLPFSFWLPLKFLQLYSHCRLLISKLEFFIWSFHSFHRMLKAVSAAFFCVSFGFIFLWYFFSSIVIIFKALQLKLHKWYSVMFLSLYIYYLLMVYVQLAG